MGAEPPASNSVNRNGSWFVSSHQLLNTIEKAIELPAASVGPDPAGPGRLSRTTPPGPIMTTRGLAGSTHVEEPVFATVMSVPRLPAAPPHSEAVTLTLARGQAAAVAAEAEALGSIEADAGGAVEADADGSVDGEESGALALGGVLTVEPQAPSSAVRSPRSAIVLAMTDLCLRSGRERLA
jgi:hypothetical protein